ncbi:MAG: thioredoxin family protein [Pseudodesulfovibrio sp.]
MLKTMEPQAFDVELQSGGEPLLVAFLKRNERFRSQYQALDEATGRFSGRLRCFLYDTDYLDVALNRFMVKGTPTFLLFSDGREVDRLIGESDRATLEEFIRSALAGH